MRRTLQYIIQNNEENNKISDFLRSRGYSRKVITALKKSPNEILLNGQFAFVNQTLKEGDCLTVSIVETVSSPNIIPENLHLEIIYEDEDILVVNKPAGMSIHPSINHHQGTLANAVAGYYERQKISYVFRCLNRLDKDTSGVVLLAKHMLSGAILAKSIKAGEIKKEYRAIVCGKSPETGVIDAPIGRKEGSVIERQVDFINGKEAMTHYRRLKYQNGYSYVAIWLGTGRTHQIRVHMKHIGHPLPGDFLYYPDNKEIDRQALHSYCLSFQHPITGEHMEFRAELPQDMKKLLRNKR
ncbi:MAG: RluA family pseudouridine synthase [Lachnospiraceae bacterium]|nr:RluA family pseudouridine synthase [Lachnospiraceae bacterium]